MSALEAFVAQNTDAARMGDPWLERLGKYAQHHAGNLYVLLAEHRQVDNHAEIHGKLIVKLHDDWGGPGVVVHLYSTDEGAYGPTVDMVQHFDDDQAHHAAQAFATLAGDVSN